MQAENMVGQAYGMGTCAGVQLRGQCKRSCGKARQWQVGGMHGMCRCARRASGRNGSMAMAGKGAGGAGKWQEGRSGSGMQAQAKECMQHSQVRTYKRHMQLCSGGPGPREGEGKAYRQTGNEIATREIVVVKCTNARGVKPKVVIPNVGRHNKCAYP